MLPIPAIDLKDNKCVRLRQGRYDDTTVFSDDPLSMAQRWLDMGAQRLHIIDLNGASDGKPYHYKIVEQIAAQAGNVPIQVGGGIRDEEAIQNYLDCGVQYTILGTRAASQPHFIKDVCLEFPSHIIVGLDVKDGKVATDGWSKLSHHDPIDLMRLFETDGISAVLYTDISRDGMLTGPDFEGAAELARAIRVPVIAAGGFASLEDIKKIHALGEENLRSMVLGRSLYEGTIDFTEALKLAKELSAQT